ncbi:MAG: DUF5702 domain-containing protein [Oscillospiraceae bacterium]|nr:DUF5702 domain-containing protein [Oscillospiraceae bacterium]
MCDRGGLSIFFAIVMFAVVALTCLLVDIARLGAAQNQAARALDIAAVSVLAGYESNLYGEYGLFAIHMPTPDASVLNEYIEKNLPSGLERGLAGNEPFGSAGDRPARLYDYGIERADLHTAKPLADLEVIERQILEYVKYRAPAALATGAGDFALLAASAAKMAGAAQINIEINRKLAEIGWEQADLRDYLYGDTGTTGVYDRYVLNFNRNAARQALATDIAGRYDYYVEVSRSNYYAQLARSRSNTPDPEADREERDQLNEARWELEEALDKLIERETRAFYESNRGAAVCVENIVAAVDDAMLIYEMLDDSIAKLNIDVNLYNDVNDVSFNNAYDKVNNSAYDSADNVSKSINDSADNVSKSVNDSADNVDKSVNDNVDDMEMAFAAPLRGEAERAKALLDDAIGAVGISGALAANMDVLSRALDEMESLRRDLLGYSPLGGRIDGASIRKRLAPDISSYNYIAGFDYMKISPRSGFADPREFVDDRITELLGGGMGSPAHVGNDKKLSDIGVDVHDLPSRNQRPWWERTQVLFASGLSPAPPVIEPQYEVLPVSNAQGFDMQTNQYISLVENGAIGYDPFDFNNEYSSNALVVIKDIGELLGVGIENLRDAQYVGEYALSIFDNYVDDDYRWAGVAKPSKVAFFDAEAEYILHGCDKQSSNMFWTKAQILTARYAMNFIHVYSDPRKIQFARDTAAAMLPQWASEALAPVVAELVLMAWSMKEAILDVENLLDGKRAPFMKLAGDWETIIGVGAEGQPKTEEQQKWSYIDYLRLFMMTEARQTKLVRICDLVEINTKFAGRGLKVGDLYCEVQGELTATVNYLFMTAPFMPTYLKTADNRHLLRAVTVRDLF